LARVVDEDALAAWRVPIESAGVKAFGDLDPEDPELVEKFKARAPLFLAALPGLLDGVDARAFEDALQEAMLAGFLNGMLPPSFSKQGRRHGQVAPFYDGQPREEDGRFTYGKMASVSTASLPAGVGAKRHGRKKESVASAWGIPKDGHTVVSVGTLDEVVMSRTGIGHAMKMYPSKEKDALLLNSQAARATFKSAHNERVEGSRKGHVDQVYRFDSRCLVDGEVRNVGIIVQHNKLDGRFHLYHIAVYGIKKAGH
jgi:hypothetical protein